MFNNKDNNASQNSISSTTTSKLDTLLGENTIIKGDIEFKGALSLKGKIIGSVIGGQEDDVLTINETGSVEGKIEVANIVVNGNVKGDITSSGKVEVASKANIEGNVYYQVIEMDTGSKVNGQLVYQESNKTKKNIKTEEKSKK